jgi:hypothetical protein
MAEDFEATWMDYLPVEAQLEWLRRGPAALEEQRPQASGALPDVSDPDLAAYTSLGSAGDRRAALERQLAMAEQLMGQQQGNYSTGIGAALGGIGGIVNTVSGGLQRRKAQQGLAELTSSQDAARARFARGARTWGAEQAGNLGVLSGDPVLGAFGRTQQKSAQNMDAGSLRALTLRQGEERLNLQKQEGERKIEQFAQKHGLDVQKVRAAIAQGWKGLDLREQELSDRGTERVQKQEAGLRDEYYQLPAVKQFTGIQDAYNQVRTAASNPSGVNDLALIFGLMKMLDPGVSVMEGDVQNVKKTAGIPDQIYGLFSRARDGQQFSPEQKQQILRTAEQVYETRKRTVDGLKSNYRTLASQTGVDPTRVVLPDTDLTKPPGTTPVGGGGPQMSDKDRAALEWLKSNPNDPRAPAIRERLKAKGLAP